LYQRSAIPGIGIEVLTLGPELVLVLGIDLGLLAVLVLVLGIVLSLLEVLVLGIDYGILRVLILLLRFAKNSSIYQGLIYQKNQATIMWLLCLQLWLILHRTEVIVPFLTFYITYFLPT